MGVKTGRWRSSRWATPNRPGGSRVSFALPVALPPDGRYPAGVAAAGHRATRVQAEVVAGSLALDTPVEGRVRVTFLD